MKLFSCLLLFVFSISGGFAADGPQPVAHVVQKMEGWTVRVDDRLLSGEGKAAGEHALRLLSNRLYEIAFILPADKVERLRQVPIQIDLTHGKLVPAQYHPSADWLNANGYKEDLARTVHIPNAGEWASHHHQIIQPWSVLHELAHAYHDQVLDFENAKINAAWEKFRTNPRYNHIPHIGGGLTRHYGLTNHKEFFAEMTESYFGVNDFEPFNRAELKALEPEVFTLLEKVWGKLE